MRRLLFPGLLLSLGLGCASSRIPNTDVPDTSENRDVIAFCERYRRAVESRDARALLAMASPRYFEDGGTPDGSDDYGLDGLQRLLTAWADEVNEVRTGMECGIQLDGFDDFQEGDVVECYTTEKVAQKL